MKKLLFIIKRLLVMIVIVFIVSFAIFMLSRVAGVDSLSVIIGDKQNISEEAREALILQYNLDKPLTVQYGIWLKDALQGNFGTDYIQKQPITTLIANRVGVTVGLVILSMFFSIVISLPLGIISAIKKNTWIDYIISLLMLVMTSTPGFLIAMIAIVILSKVAPTYQFIGTYDSFSGFISRISVPAVCLAFGNVALFGRVTRNSVIEQLNSDYVIACKAKGSSSIRIILKHVLKNSVIPLFTVSTMMAGTLVGASVLVEQIFSLPGMGSLLTNAVLKSNYPLVQALTLIMVVLFQSINIFADIMYTIVDPRIKM